MGDINVVKDKEGTAGVGDQLTLTKNSVHLASRPIWQNRMCARHPKITSIPIMQGQYTRRDCLAAGKGYSNIVRALVAEAKRSLLLPHEDDIDLEIGVGSSGNEVHNFIRMANVEGDTALHDAMRDS